MAKAYILSGIEYWEDTFITGVFSSPRKAKAYLSKKIIYAEKFDGVLDEYNIDEYDMDNPAHQEKRVFSIKEKEILALRRKKGLSTEY